MNLARLALPFVLALLLALPASAAPQITHGQQFTAPDGDSFDVLQGGTYLTGLKFCDGCQPQTKTCRYVIDVEWDAGVTGQPTVCPWRVGNSCAPTQPDTSYTVIGTGSNSMRLVFEDLDINNVSWPLVSNSNYIDQWQDFSLEWTFGATPGTGQITTTLAQATRVADFTGSCTHIYKQELGFAPITYEIVEADSDGDGIPDAIDNCDYDYNPGQENGGPADNCGQACDADLDDNGAHDGGDILVLGACYGQTVDWIGTDPCQAADLNIDGVVDAGDFFAFGILHGATTQPHGCSED